jgi:bifunctional DNase/RNase
MIPLSIVGLRLEVPSNQPIVLLREQAPGRRLLPIFVGHSEAVSIACALQGVMLPRPMTHDLLKDFLDELAARVDRVVISELRDGTFHAELEVLRDGDRHRIPARPSDALALAVRYEDAVPIVADDAVLEEAGIIIDSDDEEKDVEEQVKQLREFLQGVDPEDFA